MDFRLASKEDIPGLMRVYKKIIENMNQNKISIWDDVYPCETLKEDVYQKRLYVLVNRKEIVAAFALCESNPGESYVQWENNTKKAIYIDRLGVNAEYARQGIASRMLKNAMNLAKEKKADYVRLFVVDLNEPAINLYINNGFIRADGIYDEVIDKDITLHEYGFEIQVTI